MEIFVRLFFLIDLFLQFFNALHEESVFLQNFNKLLFLQLHLFLELFLLELFLLLSRKDYRLDFYQF